MNKNNEVLLFVDTYNTIMRICKKHVAGPGDGAFNLTPELKCVWLSCTDGYVTARATNGFAIIQYGAHVFASDDFNNFDTCIPITAPLKAIDDISPVRISDDGKTVSIKYGLSVTLFEKPCPTIPTIFERQEKYNRELDVEYEALYDPKRLIAMLEACTDKSKKVLLRFMNERVEIRSGYVSGTLCAFSKNKERK